MSTVIPVQLQEKNECEIYFETRRVVCFSYERTKTFSETSVGVEGQNANTHLQDGWFELLPRDLSLPTCIHLSWWEKLAKGSANTNIVHVHVRQESPAWVDTATPCVHACVDMGAEGVTMRFVIHFVSVYSIIHPGVQWAANMPGTACDRVRQPRSEIFMRRISVEIEKRVQRYLRPWMAFWMQMHPLLCGYYYNPGSARNANKTLWVV